MPTYLMKNTETDEVFEVQLKMSEYDQYKLDNPTHERHYNGSAPAFGDPVRLGIRKKDSGFKEVLQKIKEKTTYADFDKTSSQI
jgi:hypothetical protein